jgi:hypothetical protein
MDTKKTITLAICTALFLAFTGGYSLGDAMNREPPPRGLRTDQLPAEAHCSEPAIEVTEHTKYDPDRDLEWQGTVCSPSLAACEQFIAIQAIKGDVGRKPCKPLLAD